MGEPACWTLSQGRMCALVVETLQRSRVKEFSDNLGFAGRSTRTAVFFRVERTSGYTRLEVGPSVLREEHMRAGPCVSDFGRPPAEIPRKSDFYCLDLHSFCLLFCSPNYWCLSFLPLLVLYPLSPTCVWSGSLPFTFSWRLVSFIYLAHHLLRGMAVLTCLPFFLSLRCYLVLVLCSTPLASPLPPPLHSHLFSTWP